VGKSTEGVYLSHPPRLQFLQNSSPILIEQSQLVGRKGLGHDDRASRRWLPRRGHRGRTPMSSASLARPAANVWITSSSLTNVTCAMSYRVIVSIITRAERISRSVRIVRNPAPYSHRLQTPLSPSHKWAVCTIATNDAPRDLFWRPNMPARFGADRDSVEQLPRSNRMTPQGRCIGIHVVRAAGVLFD
jgi:hypothetical protein